MKKVFNSLFVIIAAMVTFAGCAKQEIDAPATVETKTVQFFAESIETKTHFGEKNDENKYPTLWDAGDKVKVLLNLEQIDGVSGLEKTVTAEISGDAKSARFVAELNSTYEFDAYTFYAVVPSTAYNTKNATEGKLTVVIPDTQKPQETSVDKSAQVLYAVSSTTDHFPTSVQMNFKHFVAYGKLSLANLTDKVTSISSVKLSFEENVAGKWNYLVADGSIEAKEAAKEIVLNTASTENIWFACAPVDMSGKKMTVTVNTDKGPLSKEVTFPANRKFESGKISVLTINMEGIEPEEQGESDSYYEKVTTEPEDWSGKYLIVWGTNAHATLNGKDLKSTCAVTIVENKIIANDAVNPAVMTVTKSGDKYHMTYPDGKYFAVAHNSSSSSTSAFTLSFAYTASGVKISGQATNSGTTSTYILYNNNNQYYRCYVDKSEDSNYTLPSLYKLVEGDDSGETPEEPDTTPSVELDIEELELTADESKGTIGVDAKNVTSIEVRAKVKEGAQEESDWLFAEYDEVNSCVTYSALANESEESRTAYIEVYCLDADGKEVVAGVNVTQKGVTAEPAGPQVVTVAEFLAAQEGDTVYELTGVITSVNNTEYGNFYLNDSTGEVLIYGLCSPEGEQKYWAASGVAVGDIITVRTVRSSYNGIAQGKNALYVGSVNFDINPTDINVNAEDTTAKFDLSCDAGYYIEYPDGVEEVSEVHNNETASVTYSVKFPANTDAETKTYVIKIIADADLILENPIEGVEYARTVTITQAAKPTEGEDAEPAWTLVTDVNELAVGDQVVIVAKNANYAMSTTQNNNNRAQASVTKNGNIITFGSDVQILTLKAGETSGTYAFYTGSGYLYAASSSKNHLKTESTLSANSSWKIEVASTGVATIKSSGTNTRNWMRYNSSNNPPLFSCYSSGQADICIYKLK